MRGKRQIALCCIMAVFAAIVLYMLKDAGRSRLSNSYGICINEVCSDYFPSSFAETQPPSDWIELYNFSDTSINLGEYYLSDDKNDLYKCNLPAVELLPGSYYVIHSECDEMTEEEERLNFKIKSQGENVYLSSSRGVIDAVNVPALDVNTTWSRLSDAGREWGKTERTYCLSNDLAEVMLEKIEAPVFSVEGGFYADEFELELKAPSESRIYYTTDGSEPDCESFLYEDPIRIRDLSGEPNIYSTRNDFCPLNGINTGNVEEKITVIRAMTIDEDGRKSDIVTNSYIIGKENEQSYAEMYTVSLVTDPDNLFDYNEGIYVLGRSHYEYTVPDDSSEGENYATANFWIDGKKSERPASIEIYNENGELIIDREVGIRVHGNTSREGKQKSFSVFAREMYDGEDTIEGLFGEGTTVHKFLLYANREGTRLRDVLNTTLLEDRDMATQSFIYCNVFLDGEYWGIYFLAEVYDEYYFENHYGIAQDNIQVHEGANPPEILEYLDTVPDRSEAAVYEELSRIMDIQSFIDYYAAMLYLNDNDWLEHNARSYRSIEAGPGENEDGRWRWGVWDTENTMYDAYENTFDGEWQNDPIVQALMGHEEFREQFVITYMDLYNNKWQAEDVLSVVSEMEDNIAASYTMYMERYHADVNANEYLDKLKTFLADRQEYAFEHVKEEFALNADPAWIVILSNQSGAASIRVNTSVINMPETWWQGLYFPDYPVEIAIEEVYGDNEFLGWYADNGELLSMDRVITVNLAEGTNVVNAKFNTDQE